MDPVQGANKAASSLVLASDLPTRCKEGRLQEFIPNSQIASYIPREKVSFGLSWKKKPKDVGAQYDLGQIGILYGWWAKMKHVRELTNPEIHVVWSSYCPVETHQNQMSITLKFNQMDDDEESVMYKHTVGMHLPAHHIFYPRQTVAVGPGCNLPWSVVFDIENLNIKQGYTIGIMRIFLKGYISDGMGYTQGKPSELILLAPIEDINDVGTRLSRPRTFGDNWDVGGYKLGSLKGKDSLIVRVLQQEGIDVEGIYLAKRLPAVLKKLRGIQSPNESGTGLRDSYIKAIREVLK